VREADLILDPIDKKAGGTRLKPPILHYAYEGNAFQSDIGNIQILAPFNTERRLTLGLAPENCFDQFLMAISKL
jgi:hypothetical protein